MWSWWLVAGLIYLLCAHAHAGARLIHVTDPTGDGIEIAARAIIKLRPHKGGCIIYLQGASQHVREDCAAVMRLMEGGK